MDQIASYVSTAFMILGFLAFTVSVITQVIKNTTLLKKIPTDIVVLVISIFVSLVSYFIISDIYNISIRWYGLMGSIVGGFFVAFIATYGWTKFTDLWNRYRKK